jgi:hypothetical protein
MKKQIFLLNIPAELTRTNNPGFEVTVKTIRFQESKQWRTEFIDVDTDLMIAVTDWFAVHKLAMERAEELWNGNAKLLENHPHLFVIPN